MKKIKRVLILFCVAVLCLTSGNIVRAEDALQIGIDQYEVQDGDILVYVNQNGDNFKPSAEDSSLLIGKQTLEITEMQEFSKTDDPVSFLCLVDVSGSMTSDAIDQIKEILKQFVENKGDEDNFCITTMGNNLTSSGFLTDEDKLGEAIDAIELTREDTNLYYGIKEELNVLQTDKAVHKKRCLLIFSDGADDQTVGITKEEAESVVKDSHIPIFTVAMLKSQPKDAEVESAKILGSFARYSAGGEYYAPVLDDSEYSEICDKVYDRLKNSLVVRASLEDIVVGDETVYIELELSDGKEKAKDGMTVPAGAIAEAIKELENEKINVTIIKENTEEEEVEEEPVEEESPDRTYLVIGLVVLLVVLIIAVLMILKKKKDEESEESDEYEDDYDYGADGGLSYENGYNSAGYEASNGLYDGEGTVSPGFGGGQAVGAAGAAGAGAAVGGAGGRKAKSKIHVTLFKVGPGEDGSHEFDVKDKLTIGRNKSCQLALENDSALSGLHCSILYKNGKVFVKDEESTNGTYVNGVPIIGEYKVEKDDVLLIGSSEYRITWE